jgi:hypothetical protein
LCEEQNPDRRDAGLTGNFTGPQRLAAAERIAAVTVFTQHKTVWTDIDRADVLPEDIPVRDLGRDGHTDPRFTEPAIREALSTALFTSRGERRLGWAHQTYAEFLAARYLRDLALPQILSLIVHTADPTGGVVPQLRDIAAWLAGMRQDVYDALLQRDPRVLLRSDLLRVGSDQRAALVAALLHAVAQDDYMDDGGGTTGLQHLAHPGLADQLRPSSVVIETKGCWHRELDDAMQTQLAERYLHESGCTYGLYLVGWFICEQWDASDSRKWQSPQVTLAEARDKFDNQARMLSQQGVVIKAYVLNVALR